MTESDRNRVRGQVFDLLRLIGDPEAQNNYERAVPIADVPAELVCMWFDDVYRPELPGFRSCFSGAELELLADFTIFYDARVDALPTQCEVAKLHRAPEWPAVMARANDTVDRLGVLTTGPIWYPTE